MDLLKKAVRVVEMLDDLVGCHDIEFFRPQGKTSIQISNRNIDSAGVGRPRGIVGHFYAEESGTGRRVSPKVDTITTAQIKDLHATGVELPREPRHQPQVILHCRGKEPGAKCTPLSA